MIDQTTSESSSNPNLPRPTGRPVYESTLLPTRKRRRIPPWVVIPPLLLLLLAALYFLVFAPHPRRAVSTAGMVVYAVSPGVQGVSHLWIAHADGTRAHPLTSGAASDISPVFTADGNQIAFLSNRDSGQNQIFVVDADGKNVSQVTRNAGAKTQIAYAPGSSTLLGFLSGGTLSYADSAKGDVTLLLPPPAQSSHTNTTDPGQAQAAAATVVGFAWKPADAQGNPGMAATLDTNGVQTLAILPDLGSVPHVTQNDQPGGPPLAAADSLSAAWTPDGSHLATALLHVLGPPGQKTVSGLVLLDAQGNLQTRLFLTHPGDVSGPENPVISPDGSQITFEFWRQADLASRTRLGLFLIPLNGGTPRDLVKGDAGSAQFSADGQQVFFLVRRSDGGHDLYRINTDGSQPKRLSDGHADITGYTISRQAPRP